ncbi:MAG TPA: hypothetical protein VFV58_19515 [Blastocatellia bacterium]|jgi:hypothetical protein|nr:hypothetical protein [Blastocatellia bacterium]
MKTHSYFQVAALTFALIFANNAPGYCQSPQNNPASSSQIQIVKDQVQKIGMGEDVTVILFSGVEYYGAISKVESDSFEIAEVDLRQMVVISYTEVMKVEKGYGPMNSSTGKREKPPNVNPSKSHSVLIYLFVTLGAMVGVTALAITKLGKRKPASQPFPRIP